MSTSYFFYYVAIILFFFSSSSFGAELPPGFIEVLVAEGLDPTALASSPDGRVFVAEKRGTIRIIEDDKLLDNVFLSLSVDNFNERGLLGLALHPSFEENGWLYVFYTVKDLLVNRVSRFTANGNYAIPDSELVLLDTEPLEWHIHNGGALLFGQDDKLYISIGDMTGHEFAQDIDKLNGKILRINDDGTIPADNPFYNHNDGVRRAIWSLGLRNTFAMTVSRESGIILAGDVGLDSWEEVNQIHRAANYGWNFVEGINTSDLTPNFVNPLYVYANEYGIGCAITGLAMYTPDQYVFPPDYHGKCFYSDYCNGKIHVLDLEDHSVSVFASGISNALSLHVTSKGDLYYIARESIGDGSLKDNTATSSGKVYRVYYRGAGPPFIARQPKPAKLTIGDSLFLSLRAFGDEILSFQWYLNHTVLDSATDDTLILRDVDFNLHGASIHCIVTNSLGSVSSDTISLEVTKNHRPEVTILYPRFKSTYSGGDTIYFSGEAYDVEDGDLDSSALEWNIEFHHESHTHPFISGYRGRVGYMVVPTTGETSSTVWYRLHLIATDQLGFRSRVYRDLFPNLVSLHFETDPSGLILNIDGKSIHTPIEIESVKGIFHTVATEPVQVSNGYFYAFNGWNDSNNYLKNFRAESDGMKIRGSFIEGKVGYGLGLTGEYYDDPNGDFSGIKVFERIDSTLDYNWVNHSPSGLPEDLFTIRWSGFLEVPYSDNYVFYLSSDDGSRLKIDEQVLVENWYFPRTKSVSSDPIYLEKGKLYPIQIDYKEEYGEAEFKFEWKSSYFQRGRVPKSQLYPRDTDLGNPEEFKAFPNPTSDIIKMCFECKGELAITIYDSRGIEIYREILGCSQRTQEHEIFVSSFSPGLYYLVAILPNGKVFINSVIKH